MIVYVFIIKSCGPNIKRYGQGYWVSNCSVEIKISECFPVKVICHIVDLEKLFTDNPLLKNDRIEFQFSREIKSVEFYFC